MQLIGSTLSMLLIELSIDELETILMKYYPEAFKHDMYSYFKLVGRPATSLLITTIAERIPGACVKYLQI